MPVGLKSKPKNGTKAEERPVGAKEPEHEDVPFPVLTVNGVEIPREALKVTAADIRELFGMETEEECMARMTAENPNAKKVIAKFGDDYLYKNCRGEKVRAWYNKRNRELNETHWKKIRQDILTGNFRFNCETIIIDRAGGAQSAQHRAVALADAADLWHQNPAAWPYWSEEPWIESLLAKGANDDEKTVQTLDNTKPRTDADAIYTSKIFDKLSRTAKSECARMLAGATELVWKRTGADNHAGRRTYRTHSSLSDFRDNHPRLERCVKHLFAENEGRKLQLELKMQGGECSALMYLMGCSESDVDEYINAETPSEKAKGFSWGNWDKAEEFWTELINGNKEAKLVRAAMVRKATQPDGTTVTVPLSAVERRAVIVKAWNVFIAGHKLEAADLVLEMHENAKSGESEMSENPTVGGIDCGDEPEESEARDPEVSPEEVERLKAERRAELAAEEKRIIEARKAEALAAKTRVPVPTKPATPKVLAKPLHKKEEPAPATSSNGKPAAKKPLAKPIQKKK